MWEDDPDYTNESRMFRITRIERRHEGYPHSFWVFWKDPRTNQDNWSVQTNLVRVK